MGEQCKRQYGLKIWQSFCAMFNCLPLCAVVGGKIMCVHGGLSPELRDLNQIKALQRPADIPEEGLICDLLWSDPAAPASLGWGANDRGISCTFGEDVLSHCLDALKLDFIC